eukprot:8002960-Ditylum_brightwellii.AAC.1
MNLINDNTNNATCTHKTLYAKVEALFQLKDKLLARYRENGFQDRYRLEQFLQRKSPAYIRKWLNIWQQYFRKGVKLSVQQAIANVRPII